MKDGRRDDALGCAERILNLVSVLGLTVPNVRLADDLVRLAYGRDEKEESRSVPQQTALGTGWVTADGYVVTNHHVVAGHSTFAILFSDGTELDAELAMADGPNDLALLRCNEPGRLPAGLPLSVHAPETGAAVFTLGFPHATVLGTEIKLTDGVVSARSGLGGDVRMFQISVPIQAGNSGGPLFNMAGEVVGIVVAKLDAAKVFEWTGDLPENVSYALKLAYLQPLLDSAHQLRNPRAVPSGTDTLVNLTKRLQNSVAIVVAQ